MEVRFATWLVVTDPAPRGWRTSRKGWHWAFISVICAGIAQSVFAKQDLGSLQPVAETSCLCSFLPIRAVPFLSPLNWVLVVMPQFPQPHRLFTMTFPFASFPHRKAEFSSLFTHSREVMLYLFLQGCVIPFRCSSQGIFEDTQTIILNIELFRSFQIFP